MKKYLPLLAIPLTLVSFHLLANDEPTHLHASTVAPGDYTRNQALEDMQAIADRMEYASNELLKVSLKLNALTKELEESTQH